MSAAIYCPGLRCFEETDLEVQCKLGEGSYGSVHRVRTKCGLWMAVKKVGVDWFDYGLPPSTLREVSLLNKLKGHPNIVELIGVVSTERNEGEFFLCFELCDSDLNDRLEEYAGRNDNSETYSTQSSTARDKLMGSDHARIIMRQIASAVAHIHKESLMHRDIKPMNVLTNSEMTNLKLCDFGMIRQTNIQNRLVSREAMTVYYRSPEVIMSSYYYNESCDIWSLGALFAEVLCHGKTLFDCELEIGVLFQTFEVFGTPTPATYPDIQLLPEWSSQFPKFSGRGLGALPFMNTVDDNAVDLLSKMLVICPSQRLTISEVLSHPFLQ